MLSSTVIPMPSLSALFFIQPVAVPSLSLVNYLLPFSLGYNNLHFCTIFDLSPLFQLNSPSPITEFPRCYLPFCLPECCHTTELRRIMHISKVVEMQKMLHVSQTHSDLNEIRLYTTGYGTWALEKNVLCRKPHGGEEIVSTRNTSICKLIAL